MTRQPVLVPALTFPNDLPRRGEHCPDLGVVGELGEIPGAAEFGVGDEAPVASNRSQTTPSQTADKHVKKIVNTFHVGRLCEVALHVAGRPAKDLCERRVPAHRQTGGPGD